MFGFYFAFYTVISALGCLIVARKKNRDTNIWWILGIYLGVIPLIYLLFSSSTESSPEGENEIVIIN